MDIFTAIYFVGIIIEMIIRAPLNQKRKQEKMSEQRVTRQEKTLLGLLFLGMFFLPIIYAATDWLDFVNYTLPAWAGWLGVLLIAGAVFVFWRAHADLGLNWSPSLEIREKHELITRGIYGMIRHPIDVRLAVVMGRCAAFAPSKLDCRIHKLARLHPVLFPAGESGGADDDGEVWRSIRYLPAKGRRDLSQVLRSSPSAYTQPLPGSLLTSLHPIDLILCERSAITIK